MTESGEQGVRMLAPACYLTHVVQSIASTKVTCHHHSPSLQTFHFCYVTGKHFVIGWQWSGIASYTIRMLKRPGMPLK